MALDLSHLAQSPSLAVACEPQPDWPFANVAQASRHLSQTRGERTALLFDQEADLTFQQLDQFADQLAYSLQSLGLVKGDVISFQLPNWHEAAVINLAAARLGLIINPIVIIYREHEVVYMLANSKSRMLFIAEEYAGFNYLQMVTGLSAQLPDLRHVVCVRGNNNEAATSQQQFKQHDYEQLLACSVSCQAIEPELSASDIKMLLYTSGTTGQPKGVLHTHRSLYWAMHNSQVHWSISANDIMLMASPVTHITGFCNGLEFPYYNGAKAAIMERWDAKAGLDYIAKVGATMSLGATPFLQDLLNVAQAKNDHIESLRLFACGGADVPQELITASNQWLTCAACCRVYGSSEAPLVTQGFIDDSELAAQTDGEIVNYDVQIIDGHGHALGTDQAGEIAVRGPSMMLGYLQPQAQQSAFNEQGYFLTGDLGMVTKDKAVIVTGRKKDLIIRGGENISAKQIEDVLHQHEAVREAAVVSMPHRRLGETACAFIVCKSKQSFNFEKMLAHCAKVGLARQKYPERLELLDDLPKTASGKIKKDQLRELVRDRLAGE